MKTEKEKQWIIIGFMIAFIGGILYANIVANQYATVTGVFHQGILNQYTLRNAVSIDYLLYLAKNRLIPLALLGIASTTRYRKVAVFCVIGWTGFSNGLLAVISVLRMGGIGMLLYLAALLPQYLFYVMAYALIVWYCLKYPGVRWNKWKTGFVVTNICAGIAAEAYVNPWLLHLLCSFLL